MKKQILFSLISIVAFVPLLAMEVNLPPKEASTTDINEFSWLLDQEYWDQALNWAQKNNLIEGQLDSVLEKYLPNWINQGKMDALSTLIALVKNEILYADMNAGINQLTLNLQETGSYVMPVQATTTNTSTSGLDQQPKQNNSQPTNQQTGNNIKLPSSPNIPSLINLCTQVSVNTLLALDAQELEISLENIKSYPTIPSLQKALQEIICTELTKIFLKKDLPKQQLTDHENRVCSVAFSRCGNYLASADKTVCLYSLDPNGKPTLLQQLTDHKDWVFSVAFSPCGSYLASASSDNTVCLYSLDPNGKPTLLQQLTDHENKVWSVAFSPCGRYLASASNDKTVCLYSLDNGKPILLQQLTDHKSGIWSVTFSPCGSYLASASNDKTVCLYSLDNGKPTLLQQLNDHKNLVWSVAFSPCGNYLASASSDKTVCLYSLDNGKPTLLQQLTDHKDWILSVVFSPCGSYLASASYDKTVCLYSLPINVLKKSLADLSVVQNLLLSLLSKAPENAPLDFANYPSLLKLFYSLPQEIREFAKDSFNFILPQNVSTKSNEQPFGS